jgi:hypothetical protein
MEGGSAPNATNAFNGDVGSSVRHLFDISRTTPGTYFVRVRAKNACGASGPSNEIVIPVP